MNPRLRIPVLLAAGSAALSVTSSTAQVAAPQLPSEAVETVIRVRPFGTFLSTTRIPVAPPTAPLLAEDSPRIDFLGLKTPDAFLRVQVDEVEQAVLAFLEQRGHEEDYELQSGPSMFVLRGSTAAVVDFDRVLDVLREVLPVRLEVTARLVELGAEGKDLGARIEAGHTVWTSRAVGPAGRPLELSHGAFSRYVRDYETEVAQKMQVGVPVTASLFTGVSVVVVPHALAGSSDVVMMSQGVVSRLARPIESRDVGVEGVPSIDRPLVEVFTWTSSERIASGGQSVVAAEGLSSEGDALALVLEARRLATQTQGVEGIAVLPITALTTSALQGGYQRGFERGSQERLAALSPAGNEPLGMADGATERFAAEEVEELLILALDPWQEEGVTLQRVGEHFLVIGPAAACERGRDVIAQLEETLVRNGAVDLRLSLDAGSQQQGVAMLQSIHLPALRGRVHTVARGVETLDLAQYHVEIAQEASILNPVVAPVFRGVIASAVLRDDGPGVHATFEVECLETSEGARRPTEAARGGDLDLRDTRTAAFSFDGPLSSGWNRLGDGPRIERSNQSWRSAVELRAR